MKFVSAKCPNCGAELQVARNLKSGFCNYCGSKILFEPELSNIVIDQSKSLANYRELAESAMRCEDSKNMLKYAEKALEIDSHDSEMWLVKMKAQIAEKMDSFRIVESGNNAIKYAIDVEETKITVFQMYLDNACEAFDKYTEDPWTSYLKDKFKTIIACLEKEMLPLAYAADVKSLSGCTLLHDQKEKLSKKWKEYAFSYYSHFQDKDVDLQMKMVYLKLSLLSEEDAESEWSKEVSKIDMVKKMEEEHRQIFKAKLERTRSQINGYLLLFAIIIFSVILYLLFK
ncbi:MAG: hypothetical protein IKT00_12415 [Prevotella sp.]|nr:hypothetical protein [Prevotella sp.]